MYKISKKSEYFLYKYLTTGSEVDAQKIWMKYIKQYSDSIEIDNYGTVVGIINKKKTFKIVIEAHIDEIYWYVNYITDDGFIYVAGGSENKIATSKRVNIHTKNCIIDGLFVWPAIKSPNIKKIFIDIGASNKKEVEDLGINVGCMVTYTDNFFIMNNNYFVGSALNNKIGGFIIAEVMRLIKENNFVFPYGLYVINYVKNTKIISIKPNIAIITDVCNDTTMIDKKINGDVKCGLGPVISYSTSINNNLREKIIYIANKNNLDFQRLVSPICTGTYNGVIYALISIPIRYMHTTVEMANKKDIENCIHLMFETLKSIYSNKNFKYL
ncbi:zinc-binding metallopeptidase family protein [Candidatus Karelsulcia muelleri]|uniref:M42 family metalloprotease n=1 Tax=Candidatus Karelsulcia muelleri PSPU TaxID=1189303 RepID=A0AAD1AYF3_9FLAO|nr:peptidase M42 [Candidatus Karelsulcia muelleri]NJJ98627.1 M42 family metallopeptidase [Candidatus Karelsulcia muelleri]BAO66285.1 M42 family metalloprotease [Candidatus Karelsulcia muelleri PSPU]